ncbi:MAG: DUF998 domain-containing protein [Streptosporangiaceae bacterium]|nr:DUF998 domain-containing protein [Streptosporangiaceae bacterium]
MNERSTETNQLVISYMFLRKTVGWIGSLLPIVLILGNAIIFAAPRPDSMSGYYYTHMRNVFIGALCALGVFLVAYDGYDDMERWITNIAGISALGVAFFPTKPAVCPAGATACPPQSVVRLTTGQQVVGGIHLFFAAVTFIALAFMALRFARPEGSSGESPEPSRRERVVYSVCGGTILSCVVLAAASNLLPAPVQAAWPLLFIFEALAVVAFGVSWFVKGRTMMGVLSRVRRGSLRPDPGQAPVRADV